MTLRETLRRRAVLVLLLALPLGFYATRGGDHTGQAIRSLFLGLSWAVSVAGLFASAASRQIEPRLRLSGYRSHHLYLGRLGALLVLGVTLAVPLFLLVVVDMGAERMRLGAIAVAMGFCITVGAPFGMLIAALLSRELEGTLLLLAVVGMQMTIDPVSAASRLTPLWSSRELAFFAIDHTDSGYLIRGLLHGLGYTALLILLVAVVSTVRLRHRSHLRLTTG
ncbi:MAG TPA: hypothetical protein VF755_17135 [Catenuloplanes sp.]